MLRFALGGFSFGICLLDIDDKEKPQPPLHTYAHAMT